MRAIERLLDDDAAEAVADEDDLVASSALRRQVSSSSMKLSAKAEMEAVDWLNWTVEL